MNIVIIVSDSMRRDYLGCYGNTRVRTPHLDRFAERAVRFQRYYPASLPTVQNRLDLMTGRFTYTYAGWEPLPKNEVALAEMLGRQGYVSMLVADTPHALTGSMNYQRGFTAWDLIRGQEGERLWTEDRDVDLPCDPSKLRGGERVMRQHLANTSMWRSEEDTFVAQTMRRASTWLEKNCRRQNFFLYVDTFDPHEPWLAPQPYVDLYDAGYTGQRVLYPRYRRASEFVTPREVQHMRAAYAAEVTLVDRWIGHLLGKMESLGMMKDTAIFVTADHGFLLGEHDYIGKSIIEPGEKRTVHFYEPLAAAPLLVWTPDCAAGKAPAALCSTPDLTATVLDVCGVDKHPRVQGRSFRDVLEGRSNRCRPFTVTAAAFPQKSMLFTPGIGTAVLNDGRYTYMYGGTDEKPELYDLKSDPEQKRNLIRQEKKRALAMHRRFVRWLEELECPPEHLEPRREAGL
ncbi:MAG: sulfatase [Candidatus Sumerlaeota bacterium]|nr:sulfatase [Candidatus Sumerlaeota bacterium]